MSAHVKYKMMNTRFLTRFSAFWLILMAGFTVVVQGCMTPSPEALVQSVCHIQTWDQPSPAQTVDCNVPEAKRYPSRVGLDCAGLFGASVQESIRLVIPALAYRMSVQASHFSRDFLNLSILSSKHHPPPFV